MAYRVLDDELNSIQLSVGDIIIESSTSNVGFLVKRTRRIDMSQDDMYFWEVRWTGEALMPASVVSPQFRILEEEGLKISIILGII